MRPDVERYATTLRLIDEMKPGASGHAQARALAVIKELVANTLRPKPEKDPAP